MQRFTYIIFHLSFSGYGDIAPCSNTGRAVTTFYAAMGVPLMFLVLADLGKLFTKAMKFVFRYFRRFYKTGTFRINTSAIPEDKPLQVRLICLLHKESLEI